METTLKKLKISNHHRLQPPNGHVDTTTTITSEPLSLSTAMQFSTVTGTTPSSPLELVPPEIARRILFFTPPADLAALLHVSKGVRFLFNIAERDDEGCLTDAGSSFAYRHLQFHYMHAASCACCGRQCAGLLDLRRMRDQVPFPHLPIHYAVMVLSHKDFSHEAIEAVTNGDYSGSGLRKVEPQREWTRGWMNRLVVAASFHGYATEWVNAPRAFSKKRGSPAVRIYPNLWVMAVAVDSAGAVERLQDEEYMFEELELLSETSDDEASELGDDSPSVSFYSDSFSDADLYAGPNSFHVPEDGTPHFKVNEHRLARLACLRGSSSVLQHLLNSLDQSDITKPGPFGKIPLLEVAVKAGHSEIVEILLELHDSTILERRDEVLDRFGKQLAWRQPPEALDPDLSFPIDSAKNTLLHHAAKTNDVAIARLLLQWTANPSPINARLYTPLHTACLHGSLDMIDFLLAHGSDPQDRDDRGWTALHVAVDVGGLASARALMEAGRARTVFVDLDAKDNLGRTPLQMAYDDEAKDEMIAFLVSADQVVQRLEDMEPLDLAIMFRRVEGSAAVQDCKETWRRSKKMRAGKSDGDEVEDDGHDDEDYDYNDDDDNDDEENEPEEEGRLFPRHFREVENHIRTVESLLTHCGGPAHDETEEGWSRVAENWRMWDVLTTFASDEMDG
ncbi:hypothetical protein HDU96_008858 [Phlyctochytrium bullatum]|nr:hypothetical protein HDU96_008858 [Phlyctochytrium bullatum]